MNANNSQIEYHPLKPFLPQNGKLLMLGSFPPSRQRWSMEFFYPNFQNDMWRIMGLIFYNNKNHFIVENERRFCLERIVEFCTIHGIAIFDTATAVRRLKDNASDKFLEIVESTDIFNLLKELPMCEATVTTGEKATEVMATYLGCETIKVGSSCKIKVNGREFTFYRMPSSSRAYPLSLEKKAEFYRQMFNDLKIWTQ